MIRYAFDFKLMVVKHYLEGKDGLKATAKIFNINDHKLVKEWLNRYEANGEKGLIDNEPTSYSGKFKLRVIKYMYSHHLSCIETAAHFNLNRKIVSKWENIYIEKGSQELLKERRRVRRKFMDKDIKKLSRKELEEAYTDLEMENEYIKKLNALVQERIKQEKEKKH